MEHKSLSIKIGDKEYTIEELESMGYGFDDSYDDEQNNNDDDVSYEHSTKQQLPKKQQKQQQQQLLPQKKSLPKKTTLPKQYEENMELLNNVEQFLENNHLFDIYNHDDCDSFCNEHGFDLKKSDFNNLKRLVETFDMVSNDIADIDENKITKNQVKSATSKINKIKKLFSNYI